MATRRKKTGKAKDTSVQVEVPVIQFVGREDLLELELAEVKLRNVQQATEITALKWQAQTDGRRTAVYREMRIMDAANAHRDQLTKSIGTRYNVDLTKCAIDPESGAIAILDE